MTTKKQNKSLVVCTGFKTGEDIERSSCVDRVTARRLVERDTSPKIACKKGEIERERQRDEQRSRAGVSRACRWLLERKLPHSQLQPATSQPPAAQEGPRDTHSHFHKCTLPRTHAHTNTATVMHNKEPILVEHLHKLEYTDPASQRYSVR